MNQKDKVSNLIEYKVKREKKQLSKCPSYTLLTLNFTEISEIPQCPLFLSGTAGMNTQEFKNHNVSSLSLNAMLALI